MLHSISRSDKISVGCMFALGSMCVVWCITVQITNLIPNTYESWVLNMFTSQCEMATAVAVACAPAMRTLFVAFLQKTPISTEGSSRISATGGGIVTETSNTAKQEKLEV